MLKKIQFKNFKFRINKLNISLFIFIVFFLSYLFTFIITPNINQIPYSNIVYDSKNIKIWEIIINNKYRHQKLEFNEIPEFTKSVIIDLEDKSFFKNSWIDYLALIRATLNNIKAWSIIEWASTISSQVIRNNYWLNENRTILKKFKEFYLSLALNKHYSKEEILSNYLWNIYFWYLNYWIKSASNYYFWKDLQNLTKAEQITLLSLPKNPKKYNPYINRLEFRNRFKEICNTLLKDKIINEIDYNEILNEKLVFNENHENKLPYVIDYIKNYIIPTKSEDYESWWNFKINTTIDYNLTQKIDEIAKNNILPLMWKNVKDYSIIIIDKNTKELKVMIWWINYNGENWQVSMLTSPRQVWSTLKPFTYLLAFKNLWYTPETTILDLPTQFQTNLWYAYDPKNYSLDYKWEVSIAESLSQSINIPALKVAEKVWVQNLLNFLKELWITSLNKDADYYWLALTLWVWEINLLELTKAYTLFAYNWELCDIKIINNIENNNEWQNNCKQIIDKKYTDMIKKILTNRYYKLEEFPINWNLDFPNKEVFLKTWTSRNFKDNWTIWYTSNYIIWVWAGNKDWSEMKWVSWASWAWEIFKGIVDYLEKDNYESPIDKIEKNPISYLEITSPLNNSKYKIDFLKPKNTQKIKLDFSTNLTYDNYKWFVNDKEIKDNFLSIDSWYKLIKIILYDKDGKILKEEKSKIYVE